MVRDGTPVSASHWKGLVPGLVVVVYALLSLRLLHLIEVHAVDVPFWDQWDLYEAFLQESSPWELFRWQHGPHRQGIAFLSTRLVAELSGWSSRADALAIGAMICASAGLFLALRRRLAGPLGLADVAIPLVVLTPAQYGIFLHTPNASHGAAPGLLLALYALALTVGRRGVRYALILGIDFLLVHTGFGVFAGALTPLVFVHECIVAGRQRGAKALALPTVCLGLSLLAGAVFLVGYRFEPSIEGFAFPAPDWPRYPHYVALMLANVAGVKGSGALPRLVGFGILACAILVLGSQLRALRRRSEAPVHLVVLLLVGFSLLFCVHVAIGRLPLGLHTAQATRYVPLVVPLFVGLVLHLGTLENAAWRRGLQAFAVVALVGATFPMRAAEARFMEHLARGKARWVERYLATHSIAAADAYAGLKIYPWPPATTRLQEKLDSLERRRLSLFRERDRSER